MGWGGFLDKLMGKIPIQDRIERIKNKITDLEEEKMKIIGGTWDVKKTMRIKSIDIELTKQRRLLANCTDAK